NGRRGGRESGWADTCSAGALINVRAVGTNGTILHGTRRTGRALVRLSRRVRACDERLTTTGCGEAAGHCSAGLTGSDIIVRADTRVDAGIGRARVVRHETCLTIDRKPRHSVVLRATTIVGGTVIDLFAVEEARRIDDFVVTGRAVGTRVL